MREISRIRLELSDWLYNAGIVGIANILEHSGKKFEKKSNYIEFDEELLENFEEMYFKYFIDKYLKFTSWYRIVSFEDYIINFNEGEITEKDIEKINNHIQYTKKKLTSSSYKSGYSIIKSSKIDLLKEEKKLKKIKKNKKQTIKDIIPNIKEQLDVISDIIDFLKADEVKRVILAKNIIYDVIAKFIKDVSFLHKNANKNNMYEEYKNYFINSIIEYINNEDNSNSNYNCFNCNRKISKLSKPASYDLTWINKIGVDMSRKTSHFWNFYGDAFVCPICNLVYSCIPAGFTVVRDRGLFINQNSDVKTLISINNIAIDHNTRFEELEEKSYYAVSENLKQSVVENMEKEIDNIQIVKLDSNNDRRPYTFNVLSKNKLKIIYENKKLLRYLVNSYVKTDIGDYINIYSEVIKRLYDNKNQFDLINKLLYLNMNEKFAKIGNIKIIIKINNDYLGGIMKGKMISYNTIDKLQQLGFELKKAYEAKNSKNKISGISYRLLNALKTKNTDKFMDTLINAYMYLNKEIPIEFIEGLKDEDRFQTLGYSFLLGLQGENGKKELDKENEGDEING
ncbi:CRISPR-associated protein Cst1 [Caloranaerobacter azorensis DSM 13643]|uniref:CRISPR-associated protein Cst1 n=1 Tax=Caloranaerobacter azorensis DSM 13643 TaxID=1121264 RepID=A0A1M5W6H5_9FIRM|nr:type I-B CRISPR-associated protein Cas8b1/Cst1 [Caloranaerobacter azorensis]SHH83075.1 CRISPR-associated protein Cst1 [Caloranaerobacter azorensis DSM 13643]